MNLHLHKMIREINKSDTNWMQSVIQFLRTTTLHGFKYLCSEYYVDRVGWLVCCIASTLCAGLLCTVLWARFLKIPALLEVCDLLPNETIIQRTPLVAVCPPPETVTKLFLDQLSLNNEETRRLPLTVARVLSGKSAAEDQIVLLDKILSGINMSITDMMYTYMPSCPELVTKCRWQNVMLPCELLFEKEVTVWGICCIMRPKKAFYRLGNVTLQPSVDLETTRRLDFALQCSNDSIHGCQFFTKFDGEETIVPLIIMPGFNYFAQLRFISVPQSSSDDLLRSACVSDKSYSRALCVDKCAEIACGCSDPFRENDIREHNLPPCAVSQLSCLRAYEMDNTTDCDCLPSCNKVISYTNLESNRMNAIEHAIDPIYSEMKASTSTVLFIRVNIELSRIFTLNPTETWLTLLSSLGGVFNMFLGVGLFSALEILFLIFYKLPIALMKAPEITY